MTIDATTITNEMCEAVVRLLPLRSDLLDGAFGTVEPHRNHSRAALAGLWHGLACPACTIRYAEAKNHPPGMIFVGWGHGWQPCSTCGGSGLSPLGDSLNAAAVEREATLALANAGELKCSRCGATVHQTWDHLSIGEFGDRWTCLSKGGDS